MRLGLGLAALGLAAALCLSGAAARDRIESEDRWATAVNTLKRKTRRLQADDDGDDALSCLPHPAPAWQDPGLASSPTARSRATTTVSSPPARSGTAGDYRRRSSAYGWYGEDAPSAASAIVTSSRRRRLHRDDEVCSSGPTDGRLALSAATRNIRRGLRANGKTA